MLANKDKLPGEESLVYLAVCVTLLRNVNWSSRHKKYIPRKRRDGSTSSCWARDERFRQPFINV